MNWLNWFKSEKSINTAMPVNRANSNWRTIHEPTTGAWERNKEIQLSDSLSSYAVFSCISLISKDVGKLPIVTKDTNTGLKTNVKLKGLDILRQPNTFQTRQQFFESWINSKASHGNTYALKIRDVYGDIEQLVILDANKTTPLVTPSNEVFYRIYTDSLGTSGESITVPASEIIHDRYNCFYHPLVGLSPIMACGLAASTGLNIQDNAKEFFGNMSRPSGILVSPNTLDEEDATEIKAGWDKRYSKGGLGGTAVLGDGISYQALSVPAADSQMLEHLKLSGEVVCSTFSIPSFKVGIGATPSGKVSDLNEIYYSDCLQHYIEAIENLLNIHLELPSNVSIEFELKSLIRMDSTSQMAYLKEGVGSGIFSPNEARADLGKAPKEGGDSPVMQQQNYSLSALAKRDSTANPFNPTGLDTLSEAPVSSPDEVLDPSAVTVSDESQKSVAAIIQALYKGVFDKSKDYEAGTLVTHKGSLWHCDTKHSGDFDYSNFTLAVKKGEANDIDA